MGVKQYTVQYPILCWSLGRTAKYSVLGIEIAVKCVHISFWLWLVLRLADAIIFFTQKSLEF